MKSWFFRTMYRVFKWLDTPSPLSDYRDSRGTILLWLIVPVLVIYLFFKLALLQ